MNLRRIIFWLHLIAGGFAGVVIFLMSLTGVALTYQKQMTEWADRSFWPPPSLAPQSSPLPIAELISKAAAAQPEGRPSSITFYSDPAAPAVIATQPGQNVFVNPYTGAASVGGSTAIRSFFRSMTDLHRYLSMGGENRSTGRAITGACNLAFLFIVCSGIYLWCPRTSTLQALRGITWFKPGLIGKARDFNWHNTFGFWTAIPLFFIVISGVVMSYPWANTLLYKVAGTPEPVRNAPGGGEGQRRESNRDALDLSQLDSLLINVQKNSPGWRTINLRLPSAADKQVTFSIDRSFGGQPQLRSTLVFDKGTGEIARVQTFSDQTMGQRARSWMRFVHTGEFYGVAGQTIAGIASAAGAMLVFTGLSLALRRLRAWNSRRQRSSIPVAGSLQEE